MLILSQRAGFMARRSVEKAFPVIEATNTGNEAVVDATYSAPLPAGITAGDLLIVFAAAWNNTFALQYDTPSAWNPLFQSSGTGQLRSLACFYKVADGSEGSTLAMTTTQSAFKASTSYRISNYTGTPEAGTTATGSSSNPNPPSLAPSWGSDKNLFIAVCGQHSGIAAQTEPTNYDDIIQASAVNSSQDRPRAASCTRFYESSSDDPGTFGTSIGSWAANTIVILGR